MQYAFRIIEDTLSPDNSPVFLSRGVRAIYVLKGELTLDTPTSRTLQRAGSGWVGEESLSYFVGKEGAHLVRWELVSAEHPHDGKLKSAPEARSDVRLHHLTELDGSYEWLLRVDEVCFPPGSAAPTHMHQGPGIRYVVNGQLDAIGPGGIQKVHRLGDVFVENGIDEPVSAKMSDTEDTVFVRGLLLPRAVKGLGSTRMVDEAARKAPKRQRYTVFAERFVTLPGNGMS